MAHHRMSIEGGHQRAAPALIILRRRTFIQTSVLYGPQ